MYKIKKGGKIGERERNKAIKNRETVSPSPREVREEGRGENRERKYKK